MVRVLSERAGKTRYRHPGDVFGAPVKYEQGYILPNVVAEYYVPAAQKTFNDEKALWADGSVQPAHGNYWVFEVKEEKEADGKKSVATKTLIFGKVGEKGIEDKLKPGNLMPMEAVQKVYDTKEAETWADADPRVPEKGEYWAYKYKERRDRKHVIIGKVDDPTVEARIQNRQRAYINLPAILVVILVTAVLVKGISESAGFNALMVAIKVAAVIFVIIVGARYVIPSNWTDNFAPFGWSGVSFFGEPLFGGKKNAAGDPVGMIAGAAIIFFAYIGFDSVSTHAEEAKRPQRDVPIGIIASLVICTVLYIGVVAVLTGMVPYSNISKDAGVAAAFGEIDMGWAEFIIAMAGVAGITSVLLVMMLSAPRVFLAMARDGLVPRGFFADVHPRFRTPWKSTIGIGVFVATMTAFLPIDALLHLTNIGTLFAFIIVCGAVLIMRRTNPDAERPFRCPFVPVVPILGIGACLVLMLSLPVDNWYRLFAWLGLGLVIYFLYGKRHSLLGKELRGEISAHGVSGSGMLGEGNRP